MLCQWLPRRAEEEQERGPACRGLRLVAMAMPLAGRLRWGRTAGPQCPGGLLCGGLSRTVTSVPRHLRAEASTVSTSQPLHEVTVGCRGSRHRPEFGVSEGSIVVSAVG